MRLYIYKYNCQDISHIALRWVIHNISTSNLIIILQDVSTAFVDIAFVTYPMHLVKKMKK